MSIVLTPAWLYILLTKMTGEIYEYMKLADSRVEDGIPKYASMNVYSENMKEWYAGVQEYLWRWVQEHKDGKIDTWTPSLIQ